MTDRVSEGVKWLLRIEAKLSDMNDEAHRRVSDDNDRPDSPFWDDVASTSDALCTIEDLYWALNKLGSDDSDSAGDSKNDGVGMEIMHCENCDAQLEEGRIGKCDTCMDAKMPGEE
jgi:hypothetical protein